ncbi:MAG: TetR family transcriptional regulator [Eubacteriales bacterium]|nr:TetR family transcriptional regulator [Eubacteriales bacterium]
MPSDRFYRLPAEKKQLIREAAIREFARVPFEKASINQIIQNAGISRGSFYTYFEDKQDLLEFVLSDGCDQMMELCEENLKENGGDLFAVLQYLFEYMVERLQETKDMMAVTRNVFSYQENTKLFWTTRWDRDGEDSGVEEEELPYLWLWRRIDTSRLKCETAQDVIPLLTLGVTSVMISVKQYYEHPDKLDGIREQFHQMLEVLKYGALKEPETGKT